MSENSFARTIRLYDLRSIQHYRVNVAPILLISLANATQNPIYKETTRFICVTQHFLMKERFPKKYDPSFEQALYHQREQA